MDIPARISIVTLGVTDLERAKRFYEALGWETVSSSIEGEIYWFRTADTYLGLFGYDELAGDANRPAAPRAQFGGITLAICVESPEMVFAVIQKAVEAGAEMLKPAAEAEWGGVSGYFADPDGHPWEVAFNANFPIGEDGRVSIP